MSLKAAGLTPTTAQGSYQNILYVKHNNYILLLCGMSDNQQHVLALSHFNQAIIRSNTVAKDEFDLMMAWLK